MGYNYCYGLLYEGDIEITVLINKDFMSEGEKKAFQQPDNDDEVYDIVIEHAKKQEVINEDVIGESYMQEYGERY